jgi:hypothetical protein
MVKPEVLHDLKKIAELSKSLTKALDKLFEDVVVNYDQTKKVKEDGISELTEQDSRRD